MAETAAARATIAGLGNAKRQGTRTRLSRVLHARAMSSRTSTVRNAVCVGAPWGWPLRGASRESTRTRSRTSTPAIRFVPVYDLTAVGERAFFDGNDGVYGQELWVSDGTAAGTYLVKDIVPGPEGSVPQRVSAEGEMVVRGAEMRVDTASALR